MTRPRCCAGAWKQPYDAINGIDYRYYSCIANGMATALIWGINPMRITAGTSALSMRAHGAIHPTVLASDPRWQHRRQPRCTITDTLNTPYAPNATPQQPVPFKRTSRRARDFARQIFVIGGKDLFGANTLDYRVGYTKGTWDKFYDMNTEYDYMQPAGSNITYTYNCRDRVTPRTGIPARTI